MRMKRLQRTVARSAVILISVSLPASIVTATAGFSAPSSAATSTRTAPHIMTIMMENTDYSQFAGSPAMPYLNELAHQYADFTQAYGWHYPSLPNYLELLSGSHEGVNGDCDITDPHCSGFTNETLVDQLESAGISWHAYYEGLDNGCDQGDGSGNYPYWHNPFRYFADFSTQCGRISNTSSLLSDLSGASAPDYDWVVPDLVGSGGDNGTMSSGDTWLSTYVPQIMNTPWYRDGGQIVILYDTGYNDYGGVGGATAGQIPVVVVSAHTAGIGVDPQPVTTAGVLRSIESSYAVPFLGNAASIINGSLGDALISGRPTGSTAEPVLRGAMLRTAAGPTPPTISTVAGTLALNGLARSSNGTNVEVGENSSGEGVVATKALGAIAVAGTSNLESVSCLTAIKCEAVGLAASDNDDAVLVTIVNGEPTRVVSVPSFYGLYGIDCPSSTACEAVGYDTSDDADAVTTITSGRPSPPVEVTGGGEWLNAISCPTATQCYAAGLVNYNPSIVPITSGVPQAPLTISNAWYLNGIDCPTAGNCVAVGENETEQGIVTSLTGGTLGTTEVVLGSEYLYGAACASDGNCLLTGSTSPGIGDFSIGMVADMTVKGLLTGAQVLPDTNGFGQATCGVDLADCAAVGAAFTR